VGTSDPSGINALWASFEDSPALFSTIRHNSDSWRPLYAPSDVFDPICKIVIVRARTERYAVIRLDHFDVFDVAVEFLFDDYEQFVRTVVANTTTVKKLSDFRNNETLVAPEHRVVTLPIGLRSEWNIVDLGTYALSTVRVPKHSRHAGATCSSRY
jgi:hypothetical protein